MSEFFKQLIAQLTAVWQRLSLQQKIISASLIGFTLLGLIGIMLFARQTVGTSDMKVLYSNLETEEAAEITQVLEEQNREYELANDGRTIKVKTAEVYDVRMDLAREGLPRSSGVGYEIFDKTNIGMTDFVQKMNARRALEGELRRTIEGLDEVKSARVHIVIPEQTIFLEQRKETKASVVIQTRAGTELAKDQIRGIAHLVSSSVDGLEPKNISLVDYEGRLLSNAYGSDETALASSRNLELQQNVEGYLENKIVQIMNGVMGPGKATVKVAADLDFDQVEQTLESYDPESRVIRSEERSDENTKNAPDGDHQREKSLTNYEIDRTVETVIREVGNVKRLTIAVAVDGKYEVLETGEQNYQPRSPEFMQNLEEMVKTAVGFDLARGDEITVANVQFDNEFLRNQKQSIERENQWENRIRIAKYGLLAVILLLLVFFLRYVARTLAEAMNPPVPQISPVGLPEPVPEEIPEEMQHSSELLERVEMMTKDEPVNIAGIIKQWLNETPGPKNT